MSRVVPGNGTSAHLMTMYNHMSHLCCMLLASYAIGCTYVPRSTLSEIPEIVVHGNEVAGGTPSIEVLPFAYASGVSTRESDKPRQNLERFHLAVQLQRALTTARFADVYFCPVPSVAVDYTVSGTIFHADGKDTAVDLRIKSLRGNVLRRAHCQIELAYNDWGTRQDPGELLWHAAVNDISAFILEDFHKRKKQLLQQQWESYTGKRQADAPSARTSALLAAAVRIESSILRKLTDVADNMDDPVSSLYSSWQREMTRAAVDRQIFDAQSASSNVDAFVTGASAAAAYAVSQASKSDNNSGSDILLSATRERMEEAAAAHELSLGAAAKEDALSVAVSNAVGPSTVQIGNELIKLSGNADSQLSLLRSIVQKKLLETE